MLICDYYKKTSTMKAKLYVIFLISLVYQSAISQNLSVNDLVDIYENKNIEDLNYFLSQKGWEFEKAQKNSPRENVDEVSWNFYQNNNGVNGIFRVVVSKNKIGTISYGILDTNFGYFKHSLTNSNFNIIRSDIENDVIKSVYTNEKYRIDIRTSKIMYYNESRTMYYIGFAKNEYYLN